MTILVTGSDGLLGTALKKNASSEFFFATRKDANLVDFNQVFALFKEIRPEKVIHTAAKVGGVAANTNFPSDFFYENIQMNLNIYRCAEIFHVKKLVSFISTCTFPDVVNFPITAEQLHSGPPHSSNLGYAFAKRMLDVHARALRRQVGLNIINLVPANMYGPGDNWNLESGHVIPSLIHRVFRAQAARAPLTVWGNGSNIREFIFSEDVAQLSLWALHTYNNAEPLIVTNSIQISIKKLVSIICEEMNFQGEIRWDDSKPSGQLKKPSDSVPLNKLLQKPFAFTDLRLGLRQTIDWFQNNYHTISRK